MRGPYTARIQCPSQGSWFIIPVALGWSVICSITIELVAFLFLQVLHASFGSDYFILNAALALLCGVSFVGACFAVLVQRKVLLDALNYYIGNAATVLFVLSIFYVLVAWILWPILQVIASIIGLLLSMTATMFTSMWLWWWEILPWPSDCGQILRRGESDFCSAASIPFFLIATVMTVVTIIGVFWFLISIYRTLDDR